MPETPVPPQPIVRTYSSPWKTLSLIAMIGIVFLIAIGGLSVIFLQRSLQLSQDIRRQAAGDGGAIVLDGCTIGGCSGEICGEGGDESRIASICLWRESYQCYQSPAAICRRQADGKCGWSNTPELKSCMEKTATATPTQPVSTDGETPDDTITDKIDRPILPLPTDGNESVLVTVDDLGKEVRTRDPQIYTMTGAPPAVEQDLLITTAAAANEMQTQSEKAGSGTVGDLNNDGKVDLRDYTLLLKYFLKPAGFPAKADLNRDGKVNLKDYSLLRRRFSI